MGWGDWPGPTLPSPLGGCAESAVTPAGVHSVLEALRQCWDPHTGPVACPSRSL